MSSEALKWYRDHVAVDHKQLDEMLQRLAWEANADGVVRAGQRILAHRMRRSDRHVRTALICLERLGIIQREKRGKIGGGRYSDLTSLPIRTQFCIAYDEAKAVWDEVKFGAKGRPKCPYPIDPRNGTRVIPGQTEPVASTKPERRPRPNGTRSNQEQTEHGCRIGGGVQTEPVSEPNGTRVPPIKASEESQPGLSNPSLATVVMEEDGEPSWPWPGEPEASWRQRLTPLDMSDPLALCDEDSLANNPEPDEPFEPVPDTEWPELPEGPDPEWGRRMAFVVGRQSANPLARPSQTDATDETAGCFDWDDPGYLASLEAAA